MTQENEVTTSTTNTAAREVGCDTRSDLAKGMHRAYLLGMRVADGDIEPEQALAQLTEMTATLTQQQGGEQEAGDAWRTCQSVIIRELAAIVNIGGSDKLEELNAIPRDPVMDRVTRIRIATDDYTTALRTKQPAASEVDGRACDFQTAVALEVGADEENQGDIIRHVRAWVASAKGQSAPNNTSKQAAGEAVAWQIMRAAFVTADENYSGKRVAAVYADASMIGQRVRLIFDTTPPRHPADEGAVCAEDLRWLDDIAGDLKQAGGPTNNMRLIALNRAIAALQAGAP